MREPSVNFLGGICSDTIEFMDAAVLVRDGRQRAGLTIRQLARRAGTSHSAVAAYESGAKSPNSTTLARIVEACGFELRSELVSLAPFENRAERGREIVEVLELADVFPAEHGTVISGRFPAS